MRFLPLILSNLARRKLRTLLTLLSVLVAFMLYGYMAAIARALDQGVSMAGADRLLVRNRVTIALPLPEAYRHRIARVPGVQGVSLYVWFNGIYQDPKNFFAQMAVYPEDMLRMY
ncbi:MAG: ABC transporter permease, partial [Verrucomicrobiae bacterium]|nr:ABC transporter permease [Verrucomicrobiae bacterium]